MFHCITAGNRPTDCLIPVSNQYASKNASRLGVLTTTGTQSCHRSDICWVCNRKYIGNMYLQEHLGNRTPPPPAGASLPNNVKLGIRASVSGNT